MPTEIKITLSQNAADIVRSCQTLPLWMVGAICKAMDKENQLSVSHIDAVYLSFPKDGPSVPIGCRVQSGRLRGSIRASKAVPAGTGVTSSIGSNVVYAAAQEFGADYPAQTIVPKNAKALRFMIGDRVIFAKSVKMPARHLEGRGFVRRGIADRADNYRNSISAAIVAGWNQHGKN